MYFAQHYLDCLSQAAYLIGDETTGQAVVVDPRRDVAEYLADAEEHGLRIVGVINTHFHADFLAGHLELTATTGAWIGYGTAAQTEYHIRRLSDGERISLGEVQLEIMHTPGHTPESISVLVYEHAGDAVPYGVLTGDALFIGDVGRPDLLASLDVTAQELAEQLYDSVHRKLMGLPDAVRVYPAHGAGSACGKDLSVERQSTIGEQRVFNYACQPMTRERFVALVTAGQPAAPEYFVHDAVLNRRQHAVYEADRPLRPLDTAALQGERARGAVVLDTRDPQEFAAGHLVGALNVPIDGRFAETAGMVLCQEDDIVIMAPDGREAEVALRLARIGFDRASAYVPDVDGALASHPRLVRRASRLTPYELADFMARAPEDAAPVVIDVRNAGEREAGAIPDSLHIPLAELGRRARELPEDRPVVLYCAGGWRSSVGASLLRRGGFGDVSDLLGGFTGWDAARGMPVRG